MTTESIVSAQCAQKPGPIQIPFLQSLPSSLELLQAIKTILAMIMNLVVLRQNMLRCMKTNITTYIIVDNNVETVSHEGVCSMGG